MRNTSGILDDVGSALSSILTGGSPGSPEYQNRVQMLGDAGGVALQKFAQTPEGQSAINKVSFEVGVPLLVLGLAVGYYFGKRKKGA